MNSPRHALIDDRRDDRTAPFDVPATQAECAAVARLVHQVMTGVDLVVVRVATRDVAFTVRAVGDPRTQGVAVVAGNDVVPEVLALCDDVARRNMATVHDENTKRDDNAAPAMPALAQWAPFAASAVVPIHAAGHGALGALGAFSRTGRAFSNTDLDLLERMARAVVAEVEPAQARLAVAEAERTAERQRAHHEHIVAAASDAIVTLGPDGTIQSANPAAVDLFGHPLHALLGRPYADLVHGASSATWSTHPGVAGDASGRSMFPGMSVRATVSKASAVRADGTRLLLELYEVPNLNVEPPVLTVFHRDVTEREVQMWRLERQATLLKLATHAAGGGHWTWVPVHDRLEASSAVREMLDRADAPTTSTIDELFSAIHDDDRPLLHAAVQDGVRTGTIEVEVRIRTRRGETRYVSIRGRRTEEADGRFVGFAQNVTAARTIDSLVGLPNQRGLIDTLEWAISRSHFEARGLVVIHVGGMRDIDQIDTALADRAVGEIARRLTSLPGGHGGVFRLAGAGFALLSHDRSTAERALDALTAPFCDQGTGREFALRACIGTASIAEFGDPMTLLQAAKAACRAARQDRVGAVVDHTDHSKRAERRLEIESRLRTALRDGAVVPFYQPVVDLRTGAVVGCEALARWRHGGAYVPPSEFIPLAEQSGLIHELGWSMLESTCQTLQRTGSELWASVNVAAEQLHAPGFVERVLGLVKAHGLRQRQLKLEVTERTLVTNPERIASVLSALRDGGVPVCLDDFGTGYSSLSYLHRLPLDVVKIDRSFIDELGTDPRDTRLVVAILQIARDLDLDVVAEGIETEQQRNFLHALGCRHGQGFFFARPMPVEELFGADGARPDDRTASSNPPPAAAVRRRRTSVSASVPQV